MPNQGMNALGRFAMPGASMNPLGQMAYGNPMPPGMVSGQQYDPNNPGIQMIRGNPVFRRPQWMMAGQQPGQPAINPGVAPQQAPPPPSFRSWGR